MEIASQILHYSQLPIPREDLAKQLERGWVVSEVSLHPQKPGYLVRLAKHRRNISPYAKSLGEIEKRNSHIRFLLRVVESVASEDLLIKKGINMDRYHEIAEEQEALLYHNKPQGDKPSF